MLPESEWGELATARIRAPPEEWKRIIKGLIQWNIVELLPDAEVVRQGSKVLTACAFGVRKGKQVVTRGGWEEEVYCA